MMEKDTLLEKMSYAFREKDSIISHLKQKISNTSYEHPRLEESKFAATSKQLIKANQEYRDSDSDSASERSLRSLALIMQKSKTEQEKLAKTKTEEDVQYLSHSHTETLSGSSTTSIVNKCYDKSWKKTKGVFGHDAKDPESDDNFDRDNEGEHEDG